MLNVDTSGFEAMCRDLSHMGANPFGPIVHMEAGRVLEIAARLTRAPSVGTIHERVIAKFNNYADGKYGKKTIGLYPRVSNAPVKGHKWWVDRNAAGARVFYIMNGERKWSDARWGRYKAEVAAQTSHAQSFFIKAKGARGLAANSWYQAGVSLGLDINVLGYVKTARPSNGRTYVNGSSQTTDSRDAFYIDLFNHLPALAQTGGPLDGASILQRAISNEVKYFETLVAKGFFDNVKKRAERYPGVFVS
jgi:hypothetical protein